jgi:DNA topoisomerase-1
VLKDAVGRRVTDKATLARVRALAIPPAWTNVWICRGPDGHIQAVGRDARGRKQYRYHPEWTSVRDASKFDRLVAFGEALPKIRAATDAHLRKRELCRDRVLATIVRIMEKTAIRVGNDEYARANGSYGLTTMRDRHATVNGATVRFHFRAKSGILQHVELDDARLAAMVKRCQDLPGQTLFQYIDDQGGRRDVDSSDVNAYLRAAGGGEFSAKDFRTWNATVLAAAELAAAAAAPGVATLSMTGKKRLLNDAIGRVAEQLGNTRAVCRKCYIHPEVIDSFLSGKTVKPGSTHSRPGLTPWETAVVAFLKR